MASVKKEDKELLKTQPVKDEQKPVLLTEEEYEKIARQKRKEKLNRISRVAGVVALLLLMYAGCLDTIFEMSFFGWMFAREEHRQIWEALVQLNIFDDFFEFGTWLPKIGITCLFVAIIISMIYLLTFNIIDFVLFFKQFIKSTKALTKELTIGIKEGAEETKKDLDEKPRKKKKSLFSRDDLDENEKDTKKEKKKKEKKEEPLMEGYTEEQLNALLAGETIDVPEGQKSLFDDTENKQ